eukprot:CAMPEP_0171193176 /NCGR_PEP_ID=MMETSP0790-20130122/20244_1 /TAXON_ID=2925 /ORGANISM="Alexandrium catenella, Strain OF101" /LENGTH=305 /DNA_ID=CAMNT_0011658345 /DNA_START=18 /DNA_END=933 /DNA_ORIENTATION=+
MAGALEGEGAVISPALANAGDEGQVQAKERRRRKKKPEARTVFESAPATSTADERYGASVPSAAMAQAEIESALEQAEAPACVFESQPRSSRADSSAHAAFERQGSHAEAAQALIAAAAEASEHGQACVFESQPRQSVADAAAHGACRATGSDDGVFESAPAPSRADVLHGAGQRHAEAAEATILQAAEQAAHAPAGVFESKPARSKADYLHGGAGNDSRAAQALIQRVAEGAGDSRSSGVFESQPAQSTASVRHGQAAESSSEYETDSEEEGAASWMRRERAAARLPRGFFPRGAADEGCASGG